MYKLIEISLIITLFLFSACNGNKSVQQNKTAEQTIITDHFELHTPANQAIALLVLFGGFPETPARIKKEFDIIELARKNGIAVMLMNFNRKLWLEESEKATLAQTLATATAAHKVKTTKIFIGGFSSGGNISLLLANYLVRTKSSVQPTGVFVVDSPIDLLELYKCSKRNVERNFMAGSVRESQATIERHDNFFGKPESGIEKYELYSPYISKTNNITNLSALKDVSIRLYTEPDIKWWKENRQNDYEDMNACYIKMLTTQLKSQLGNPNIQLIETENKGYRANGMRHPHSWSIVNKEDLIGWILEHS